PHLYEKTSKQNCLARQWLIHQYPQFLEINSLSSPSKPLNTHINETSCDQAHPVVKNHHRKQ
ncbi:hypothetical protein, partial [Bartonella sp. AS69XJJH]|uniref:hypothetical protein n=1 Tax=Bartonella sp. AS69XJJH TaxID=3243508 RepID=UPI0035CF959B